MTHRPMRAAAGAALAAGLALTAPARGAAQTAFTLPPIPIDTFTLANGLRVIVSEDHSAPVVAVSMWYHVGSAHEPPGRSGFAHFFEHMLFEETENLADGQLDELITQAGGMLNGTTDQDRTAYWEILPANRVNLSLWAAADRMDRLRVTERGFENQREVVKEERRMRVENQPYAGAQLALDTLATDWLPYRHLTIGTMGDLDAATAADALEFYERYYVPNNAVLTVVGDVTTAQIRALAREYFGAIPRGSDVQPLPPLPATPRTDGERRVTMPDPMAQLPLVWIAYNVPPANHPDAYALTLLSSIFSGGESSRLQRRLVQDEQAALDVVAFLSERQGPGMLLFGGIPNLGVDVARLEALVADEIAKLLAEGVTERELQKAKHQRRADEVADRLQVQSKGDLLQSATLRFGDPFRANDELARFEAVTLEDVRRVARTYLTPANRTVVIAQPTNPMGG
jgi:predicted Zn-dependent peptidase